MTLNSFIQSIARLLGKEGSLGSADEVRNTLLIRDNTTLIEQVSEFLQQKKISRTTPQEYAAKKQVTIGIHYPPPSSVGNLSTSPTLFAAAMLDTYQHTRATFG